MGPSPLTHLLTPPAPLPLFHMTAGSLFLIDEAKVPNFTEHDGYNWGPKHKKWPKGGTGLSHKAQSVDVQTMVGLPACLRGSCARACLVALDGNCTTSSLLYLLHRSAGRRHAGVKHSSRCHSVCVQMPQGGWAVNI